MERFPFVHGLCREFPAGGTFETENGILCGSDGDFPVFFPMVMTAGLEAAR